MHSFVQVPHLSTLVLLVLLITIANLIWALICFTFSSGHLYFSAVSLDIHPQRTCSSTNQPLYSDGTSGPSLLLFTFYWHVSPSCEVFCFLINL